MVKSKHTVILYSMLILIMNLLQRRVRYMGFDYKTIMKTRGIRARAVAVPLGGGSGVGGDWSPPVLSKVDFPIRSNSMIKV